jgi:hypothetical protein
MIRHFAFVAPEIITNLDARETICNLDDDKNFADHFFLIKFDFKS